MLVERAAGQREQIHRDVAALAGPIAVADRGIALYRFVRERPALVAVAGGILLALRPRRALAWGRRAFLLWRGFRWASAQLNGKAA